MTVFQNVRCGLIPARLTVADVYALTAQGVFDGDDAFELVEGEIVPMAAAKASEHEMMKSRLTRLFARQVPDDLGVWPESSVTLSGDTLLEPDLALWPQHISNQDVRGPDIALIVEVSSSTISYDLKVKPRLYAMAGVREYWVVDAQRYTIRVHRAPEGEAYVDVEEYEAHDRVEALIPGVAVRIDELGLPPRPTIHRSRGV